MNDSSLRLYVDAQFTSPYAMSCFVALREKGIEFEMSTLDLDKLENQASDYARLSLTQRVPTLVQGDFALSESSAITEYLEDVFPSPLFTHSIHKNARQRGKFKRGYAVICSRSDRSALLLSCSMDGNTDRCQRRPRLPGKSWLRSLNGC